MIFALTLLILFNYSESTYGINDPELTNTIFIKKTTSSDEINKKLLSPLQQFNSGIDIDQIICKDGLELVMKKTNKTPVCVKPETAQNLIERGWANKVLFDKENTQTSHDLSQTYELYVGEQVFKITYSLSGGTLLLIEADIPAKALIIQLETSDDGEIKVSFPHDLINARIGADGKSPEDGSFFVLVDGVEVNYEESQDQVQRTLTIPFDSDSKQIEIIGM